MASKNKDHASSRETEPDTLPPVCQRKGDRPDTVAFCESTHQTAGPPHPSLCPRKYFSGRRLEGSFLGNVVSWRENQILLRESVPP